MMSEGGMHEKLERRVSKSRLSKQVEVQDEESSPPSGDEGVADNQEAEESEEEEEESIDDDQKDAMPKPVDVECITPIAIHSPPQSPSNQTDDSTDDNTLKADSSLQCCSTKLKVLVRSQAVRDDCSPPPPHMTDTTCVIVTSPTNVHSLLPTLQRRSHHGSVKKLEKDNSLGSEHSTSPALSRESSTETYTDSTGIDLEEFIKMTLNKNPKDRQMLLKLEQDLTNFIKESKPFLRFSPMTSYHRMLVHRVAAFFGLDHNVDQSGKCVVVNRTNNTRLPEFKFHDHYDESSPLDDQPKRMILQRGRECLSAEEGYSYDRHSLVDKKSKSLEEREEEYVKARARIFNKDEFPTSQDGLLESAVSMRGMGRCGEPTRWLGGGEPRAWSSTDSSGYSTDSSGGRMRLAATKASSFHGVMNRSAASLAPSSGGAGDASHNKTDCVIELARPRMPASSPPSGSQVSESGSSCQSATSAASPSQLLCSHTGDAVAMAVPFAAFNNAEGQPMAIWVASTLDSIPIGSVLINPLTVEPYMNTDGTVYRWTGTATLPPNQQMVATNTAPPTGQPANYTAYAPPMPPPPQPQQQLQQQQQQLQHQQQQQQQPQQQSDIRTYPLDSSDADPVPTFTGITITDEQQQQQQQPPSQPLHDTSIHQQGACIPVPMATVVSPTAATAVVQHGYMPTSAQVPYYTNNAAGAGSSPPYRCVYPAVHYMPDTSQQPLLPAAPDQHYSYTVVSQPYTPPQAAAQPGYGGDYAAGTYVYYPTGGVCNGAQSPVNSAYRSPRQQSSTSSYVVPLSGYAAVRQPGYSAVLRPANGLANRTPPPMHYHSPVPQQQQQPPPPPPPPIPPQLKVMPMMGSDEGYVGAPVVQKVPLLRPAYTMAPFAMAAPPSGARLVGQPLQVASPSYYTARVRPPVAMPQSVPARQTRGRKQRKDLSPHSSTESMESCGSALCPPATLDIAPSSLGVWRPEVAPRQPSATSAYEGEAPGVRYHRQCNHTNDEVEHTSN